MRKLLAAPVRAAFQHRALLHWAESLIDRFQRGIHLAERHFRQEAERTQIDREYRNTLVGDGARGRQKGAISSQHQHEVRLPLAELRARNYLLAVDIARGLLVEVH